LAFEHKISRIAIPYTAPNWLVFARILRWF